MEIQWLLQSGDDGNELWAPTVYFSGASSGFWQMARSGYVSTATLDTSTTVQNIGRGEEGVPRVPLVSL